VAKFEFRFEPAEDDSVDDCTAIIVDGKEVGDIQHGQGGYFYLNRHLHLRGEFAGSQDLGTFRSLALAVAAAKEVDW
jgi:hypothetical protein